LGVGSGSHGQQTGKMLDKLEDVLISENPDIIIVHGDTNSTLAGSLTASKLHIPIAHVESGLRSFDKKMPEEINRIVTDHISDILFCPTEIAMQNLDEEGLSGHMVGDCMYDVLMHFKERLNYNILDDIGLYVKEYLLMTLHRPSNVDNDHLREILNAVSKSDLPVVFPIHPRTSKMIRKIKGVDLGNILVIPPIGYIDFLSLMKHSNGVITDSGGVQKEAYWLKKRCITVREETEWVETVDDGWNILTGADYKKIEWAIENFYPGSGQTNKYGDGKSVEKMIQIIEEFFE